MTTNKRPVAVLDHGLPLKSALIWDHNGFCAFDKPSGISSAGSEYTGYPQLHDVVVENLGPGSGLAHRIDRFTSGIMIGANNGKALGWLAYNWHRGAVHKHYLALIPAPVWDYQEVSSPIGGKDSTTGFTVLDRSEGMALVNCELMQAGLTHQIRRHLKKIDSYIIGDYVYKHDSHSPYRMGQLLHAWRIEVRLPEFTDWNGQFRKFSVHQPPGNEITELKCLAPEDFRLEAPMMDWNKIDDGALQPIENWVVHLADRSDFPVREGRDARWLKMKKRRDEYLRLKQQGLVETVDVV